MYCTEMSCVCLNCCHMYRSVCMSVYAYVCFINSFFSLIHTNSGVIGVCICARTPPPATMTAFLYQSLLFT